MRATPVFQYHDHASPLEEYYDFTYNAFGLFVVSPPAIFVRAGGTQRTPLPESAQSILDSSGEHTWKYLRGRVTSSTCLHDDQATAEKANVFTTAHGNGFTVQMLASVFAPLLRQAYRVGPQGCHTRSLRTHLGHG